MANGFNLTFTDDPNAPPYWDEACQALINSDTRWAAVIDQHRDRALRSRGQPFETLLRAIVGQQISVIAADRLWERFTKLVDHSDGKDLPPSELLSIPIEQLASVGLSRRKAEYMQHLAEFAQNGGLEYHVLHAMPDEHLLHHLTAVRGIGRWTAEMFLLFTLRRADVWPVDDIGLLKGIQRFHALQSPQQTSRPTPREALAWGEHWRPWRSVATWYLWRLIDPVTVDY